MGPTACGLVAKLIDWIEGPHSDHGRPRCPTHPGGGRNAAVLSARRRAMAGAAGHRGSGLRCDAAAPPERVERGGPAAPDARRTHSEAPSTCAAVVEGVRAAWAGRPDGYAKAATP